MIKCIVISQYHNKNYTVSYDSSQEVSACFDMYNMFTCRVQAGNLCSGITNTMFSIK